MKLDAIIVLGAGMTKNQTLPDEAKERLDKAIEIFDDHTVKHIILSGKYSYKLKKKPRKTEAELMKVYLRSRGIPAHKIIKEEHSKDTFGNAYFTKQYIIDPKGLENIAVVTSDYHIPRSAYLFRKVFGHEYSLHFIGARSSHSTEQLYKLKMREQMVLLVLKRYLSHIKPGDMPSLRQFIYSKHPIYKSKAGAFFEIFVKGIKVLEPKKKR